MACYAGAWYRDWPVVFLKDKEEVPLGGEQGIEFLIINVEQSQNTFDLELNDGPEGEETDVFTTFADTDTDQMEVTVPGKSSKTHSLEVKGNSILSPQTVSVQATAVTKPLSGQDKVKIEISETSSLQTNSTSTPKDMPGIMFTQITWLITTATILHLTFITKTN